MEIRFCPSCGGSYLKRARAGYLFECVDCNVVIICVPADNAQTLGLTPRQLFAVDELRYAMPLIGEDESDKGVSHAK
jgi:hypothetical protein